MINIIKICIEGKKSYVYCEHVYESWLAASK